MAAHIPQVCEKYTTSVTCILAYFTCSSDSTYDVTSVDRCAQVCEKYTTSVTCILAYFTCSSDSTYDITLPSTGAHKYARSIQLRLLAYFTCISDSTYDVTLPSTGTHKYVLQATSDTALVCTRRSSILVVEFSQGFRKVWRNREWIVRTRESPTDCGTGHAPGGLAPQQNRFLAMNHVRGLQGVERMLPIKKPMHHIPRYLVHDKKENFRNEPYKKGTAPAIQRHDGNTARLARRSDEATGVRVSVARIAPSLLDIEQVTVAWGELDVIGSDWRQLSRGGHPTALLQCDWLDYSPPTFANRVRQFPAGSLPGVYLMWGIMPYDAVAPLGSAVSPALSFRRSTLRLGLTHHLWNVHWSSEAMLGSVRHVSHATSCCSDHYSPHVELLHSLLYCTRHADDVNVHECECQSVYEKLNFAPDARFKKTASQQSTWPQYRNLDQQGSCHEDDLIKIQVSSLLISTWITLQRWSGAGMQVRWERECPEKTRRQAASPSTVPARENSGVNRPGIEPGSPWREASALATAPPLPRYKIIFKLRNLFFSATNALLNGDEATICSSHCAYKETRLFTPVLASFTSISLARSPSLPSSVSCLFNCHPLQALLYHQKRVRRKSDEREREREIDRTKDKRKGEATLAASKEVYPCNAEHKTARPRTRSEGTIRATLTRTPSVSSLLRARRAAFPSWRCAVQFKSATGHITHDAEPSALETSQRSSPRGAPETDRTEERLSLFRRSTVDPFRRCYTPRPPFAAGGDIVALDWRGELAAQTSCAAVNPGVMAPAGIHPTRDELPSFLAGNRARSTATMTIISSEEISVARNNLVSRAHNDAMGQLRHDLSTRSITVSGTLVVTETSTLKSSTLAGGWARTPVLHHDRPMRYTLYHDDKVISSANINALQELFLTLVSPLSLRVAVETASRRWGVQTDSGTGVVWGRLEYSAVAASRPKRTAGKHRRTPQEKEIGPLCLFVGRSRRRNEKINTLRLSTRKSDVSGGNDAMEPRVINTQVSQQVRTSVRFPINPPLVIADVNVHPPPPPPLHNHQKSQQAKIWIVPSLLMIYCPQLYGGNTARLARRSDEALGVRVSVALIAPSLLDLGRGSHAGARRTLYAEFHMPKDCSR
ncbi:hypothetical protein PR048_007666 [Dryococelus australis]|uniref:Uncharacterized protein n=1 Tax=Dryococelus australis TaxID=614101 RepID=A0ABQ9HUV6_9NEOP|nr:hypothetical protein PR048_007666 [Dryococelus australis]